MICALALFVASSCSPPPNGVTVNCAEDEYVSSGACLPCAPGSTNLPDPFLGPDTSCDVTTCSEDEHVSNHRCLPCELGKVRGAGDEATGEDTFCALVVCETDQHVRFNMCQDCPPGSTNARGDRVIDGESFCDPTLCAADMRVGSHECVACPPGTTNESGDDASQDDTSCDPTLCPENHRVESHGCVPCSNDTMNDAGDDASGDDTSCRPAACALNEHVIDNVCVPCPDGSSNLAGDNAREDDTACDVAVVELAAGDAHSCARFADGRVQCWGDNGDGELGVEGRSDIALPRAPIELAAPALAVRAGKAFTCALLETGEVWCWGNNARQQLGAEEPYNSHEPTRIPNLPTDIIRLTTGSRFACAESAASGLYCWGDNTSDQLGTSSGGASLSPHNIAAVPRDIAQLTAGEHFACALTDAGKVWCWGANRQGQLGEQTTGDATPREVSSLPPHIEQLSAGGDTACALARQGDGASEVWCWGEDQTSEEPVSKPPHKLETLPSDVDMVRVGKHHSCAHSPSRGLYCWGANAKGEAGVEPAPVSSVGTIDSESTRGITQLALGSSHSCALDREHQTWCWGNNYDGQLGDGSVVWDATPSPVEGLPEGITELVTKQDHTCALSASGELYCWGRNDTGQLGNGQTLDSAHPHLVEVAGQTVRLVDTGTGHTCARTASQALYCWGDNRYGQLGDLTTTNRTTPTYATGMEEEILDVACGERHTCVIESDKSVSCWGDNQHGQLTNHTVKASLEPFEIYLGLDISDIESGLRHVCSRAESSSIRCWGYNWEGQAHPDITNPTKIFGPVYVSHLVTAPKTMTLNSAHTCITSHRGLVQCWGNNDHGQLGDGTRQRTTQHPTFVLEASNHYLHTSAGLDHTCGLKPNSTVRCWGNNSDYQLGTTEVQDSLNPRHVDGLSAVSTVEAGAGHTCAVLATGEVFCWGANRHGQLGRQRVTSTHTPTLVSFED